MLQRVFVFEADQRGRVDFRLCYEAFRGRNPEKITKEERGHLAAIQTALEAISAPLGEEPDTDIDLRMRKLHACGGRLVLSQRAFEKLLDYLDEAPFQAGLSAQVESLRDRLGAAEKLEPSVPSAPTLAMSR